MFEVHSHNLSKYLKMLVGNGDDLGCNSYLKEHGNYTIVTSGQLYNELSMKC